MPWNGIGTYNLPPAYSPEANGTVIDAARYNGLTSDVATGISNALTKDGQNVPTANLPMGGFKHTGVDPVGATATGQYLAYGQTGSVGLMNFALGAAATPSITFIGDLNTGMWSPGADTLAWSTNGVERFRADNLGGVIIGGTTPATASGGGVIVSSINAGNTAALDLLNAGTRIGTLLATASEVRLGAVANVPLTFYTNNTERGRFDAAGNFVSALSATVGLAAASGFAAAKLWVHQAVNKNAAFYYLGADPTFGAFDDAGGFIKVRVAGAGLGLSGDGNVTQSLGIDANNRLFGASLHNNAAGLAGTTNYWGSGTYVPAPVNVANTSALSGVQAQWIRVGQVVHMTGGLSFTTTAGSTTTTIDFPPPIASAFALAANASGAFSPGVSVSTAGGAGSVVASGTNIRVSFISGGSAAGVPQTGYFSISYVVV